MLEKCLQLSLANKRAHYTRMANKKPVHVILSECELVSWEQFNKNATFGGHFIDTHLSKLQGRQYFIIAYENPPPHNSN